MSRDTPVRQVARHNISTVGTDAAQTASVVCPPWICRGRGEPISPTTVPTPTTVETEGTPPDGETNGGETNEGDAAPNDAGD